MFTRICQLLLVILISSSFSASAYSGTDWKITLRVSGGGTYDYCIAGVKDGAADGQDNAWDIPAPPGTLNDIYIYTYFPHPEWGHVFDTFRQDIKAPDFPKEWVFEVVSNISGELTVQWPDLKEIIPDKDAVLVDIDGEGGEIDMHASSSFVFMNNGYPRKFLVTISQIISASAEPISSLEPPKGLKGQLVQRKAVLLHWKRNHEPDLAGYNVYRSDVTGSGYLKINDSLLTKHRYIDEQAEEGRTYYYVVTAVNTSEGESGDSNEVEITIRRRHK
ncbi:MAG: fibronectin type III domain-containing protein [Deltaproteobacteria bacterium]|nr:fibronectin type III domain-containing protein [Deltaproteobacteria bacterium]